MSKKLFVGGLSYDTTSERLREVFERYGDVEDAFIIKDKETKQSKGFGFVTMATEDGGDAAMDGLNGEEIDGRELRVDEAKEQGEKRRGGRDSRR